MVMQNKNFEEFMDFRDMIQGGSLDDRMEMVNYMSNKPVMARQEGGPAMMSGPAMMEELDMDVEPIAKRGDSLSELYAEALLAKNPAFFDKFYEEQKELNIGIKNIKNMLSPQVGLSSIDPDLFDVGIDTNQYNMPNVLTIDKFNEELDMPQVNASFGGFLKDLGINIGKAVIGDVVGAGIGAVADSFTNSQGISPVGDFFDSSAGRGLTSAATNAALDYGFSEYFDEGQGPNIGSFGFDFVAGALGDYATRPKEERDFYGFDVDKEEEELKRRFNENAITLAEKEEGVRQTQGVRKRRKARMDADTDFLSRLGRYSGLLKPTGKKNAKGYKALEFSGEGLLQRSLVPIGSAVISEAERQSATPLDPNQGQGGLGRSSKFIPGFRKATVRVANVDRRKLTQKQLLELRTKGKTIHEGKEITAQDLIGGVSYLPSTQTAKQGGLVSLNEGGQPDPTFVAYKKWLDSHGGVGALDPQSLRQGRVTVLEKRGPDQGPVIFSYDQGGERGAGLYDDYEQDYQDFPFAYREHPDYNSQWSTGGILPDKNFVNQVALDTRRKEIPIIDPDEDNEDFILSLLFPDRQAKQGGLVNRARGGEFSGMIGGDGHGMEDNVQMPIVSDGEQVATLAVSPKEYVVDAYTMAALGNGNPDEGAKIMDQTIKGIRQRAYGTKKQPNEINGTKALQSGLTSLG